MQRAFFRRTHKLSTQLGTRNRGTRLNNNRGRDEGRQEGQAARSRPPHRYEEGRRNPRLTTSNARH
jgi:hypothetical protein